LEAIHADAPRVRFLQAWLPDSGQLVFGYGDSRNGVLVHSDGAVTVAQGSVVPSRFPRTVLERQSKASQVSGLALFGRIEALLRAYLHLEDARLYTLVALWVVGTYLYTMFSHFGYLFLHSRQPRSGKTRVLEIVSHLAFEATSPLNAPTPATIREYAAEGRTIQLDTLERWKGKSKEAFSAAMELLDAGFRNGGVVVKMVPVGQGVWRRESFQIFAPYAMAGIRRESLSDTALDRSFVVEMHRKAVRVRKRRYNFHSCETECKLVREDLYFWALQHARQVASVYESAELEVNVCRLGLNDRAADIWKPLFAVAQVLAIESATIRALELLAKEMGGDPDVAENGRNLEIVRVLRRCAIERKETTILSGTRELLSLVSATGIEVGESELHELLTRWGFEQKSSRLPDGPRRAWRVSDTRLAEIEQELSLEGTIPVQNADYRDYTTGAEE
jgi:hypothetical protein